MAAAMTNGETSTIEAGSGRARSELAELDVDLMRLAGVEGRHDGAGGMSHHTPSPTRGERVLATTAHLGQHRLEAALGLDAAEHTREIAEIDDVSQRVDRGKTVHPPLLLRSVVHLGLAARMPTELVVLVLVGGIEADMLADPIQTTFNLASWLEALVISSAFILLVMVLSHLFAEAWIRARETAVPAARDSLRRVAGAFAAVVVLCGVMAVVARAFSLSLTSGAAGGELAAWTAFVALQVVFLVANLSLAVHERTARLHLWLGALRARRITVEAAHSEQAIASIRRELWAVVLRAICNYRHEVQATNESGLFKAGWEDRTAADLSQRRLLRQVFPTAPVDPAPTFGFEEESTEDREDAGGAAVAPTTDAVTPETGGAAEPSQAGDPTDPLERVRRQAAGGHAADPTGQPHGGDVGEAAPNTVQHPRPGAGDPEDVHAIDVTDGPAIEEPEPDEELDDLIAQVLGEAGEAAA